MRNSSMTWISTLVTCVVLMNADAVQAGTGVSASDCTPVNTRCGCEGYTTALLAGQTIPAGVVNVSNSDQELVITIEGTDGWLIQQVHIYAGKHLIINPGGNVPPGQMPYHTLYDPPVDRHVENILIEDLKLGPNSDVVVIAVHTVMVRLDPETCEVVERETAWAEGPIAHPGSQWGWSFCFELLGATSIEMFGVPEDTEGQCGALPEPPEVIALALCDDQQVEVPVTYTEIFACPYIVRRWTARCGSSVTREQLILVEDNQAPELTPPPDLIVECDEAEELPPQCPAIAVDDCDPDPVVTYVDTESEGSCPQERIITRTWTATDSCGNSTSADQIIMIVDTTAPTLQVPPDVTIECDEDDQPANTGQATASDNCDPAPAVTFDDRVEPGSCPQERVITRTWTATDACGNSSSADQIITVVDTTAPSLSIPDGQVVECDGAGNVVELGAWLGSATAGDNCGSVTLENDFAGLSDDCAMTGSTTVTWTATDACGNVATASATFSIVDTTPPSLSVPADLAVECDGAGNVAELEAWLGSASGGDECGDFTITHDYEGLNDDCGGTGSALVTWTAIDACGNVSTQSATFSIIDTTPPSLSVSADQTVECDGAGNGAELEAWLGGATGSDECSDITITHDYEGLNDECGGTGSALVTWMATDACGNTTSASATFTLADTTPPVLTPPADVAFDCDQTLDPAADYGEAVAVDQCDSDVQITLVTEEIVGTCANIKTIRRTFTATDDCGNSVSHTQTVTIGDATPPVVDASIEHRSFKNRGYLWPNNHKMVDVELSVTATDNCDDSGQLAIAVHVFADEDEMADTGSGTTSPDAKLGPVRLRTERMGVTQGGDGRVYLIVVTATDCAGNVGYTCLTATVPIDQKKEDIEHVLSQAAEAEAACDEFAAYVLSETLAEAPLGYFVVGVAPPIGPKQ